MIPIPEDAESYSEESTRTSAFGDSQECLDQPDLLVGSGACVCSHEEERQHAAGAGPRGRDGGGAGDGRGKKSSELEGLCDLSGLH